MNKSRTVKITDKEILENNIIGMSTLAAYIDEMVGFKTQVLKWKYNPNSFVLTIVVREYNDSY